MEARTRFIEVVADGPVAEIILSRPEQRNALSIPMLAELSGVLGDLAARPPSGAVVLRAAGPDFCAGADMAELENAREGRSEMDFDQPFREALDALRTHPSPVIARVQGRALGGGCQLVLACDLAVAATDARIGIPSARLGVVAPLESIDRLAQAVGPKRAAEMLLAGRILSGIEAEAWGLVNRTAEPERMDEATGRLAEDVTRGAPLSVRASKRGLGLVGEYRSAAGDGGLTDFDMMAAEAFASEDLGEGIRAFRERRPPRFKGS